jgi:hypothetical protein
LHDGQSEKASRRGFANIKDAAMKNCDNNTDKVEQKSSKEVDNRKCVCVYVCDNALVRVSINGVFAQHK